MNMEKFLYSAELHTKHICIETGSDYYRCQILNLSNMFQTQHLLCVQLMKSTVNKVWEFLHII